MLLRPETSGRQRYDDLLRDGAASPEGPRWWEPALIDLALDRDDLTPDARTALADWLAIRQDCFYAVVQEETDDHLSLTASCWPLVDDRGRLRFPTSDDPIEIDAERDELQGFLNEHRARWRDLDLIDAEQATRPIRLGDTFAIRFERPQGTAIRLHRAPLRRSRTPVELTLEPPATAPDRGPTSMNLIAHSRSPERGHRRRRRIASTSGLVIDITWDARQAGKVAQLAAFSGLLVSGPAPTGADDELITQGLERQLRALEVGLTPDEAFVFDSESTEPAAES